MANRTQFGGFYNAIEFNYGGGLGFPPALIVQSGPSSSPVSNPGTLVLQGAVAVRTDGLQFYPLNTNAPTLVGSGANQEKVTPSAVTNPTSPVPGNSSFTGTFTNIHGQGDPLASATFGLQEAINEANRQGGGVVLIDAAWANAGGTTTIKNAAVIPSPTIVTIQDNRT